MLLRLATARGVLVAFAWSLVIESNCVLFRARFLFVVHLAYGQVAIDIGAVWRSDFMLVHRIIVGIPLVYEDETERADDVIGQTRWFGVVEKTRTSKGLWCWLFVVHFPVERPAHV